MSISFVESREAILQHENENILLQNTAFKSITPISSNETWVPVTDKDYDFYDDYLDENISYVDEDKNITLNPKQINLTQETHSQYIPFIMPRYYDGFDLVKTQLRIYFLNKDKQYGISYPVDVYYSDTKIKFAWLIDNSVTSLGGKIKFEIQAIGKNSKELDYVLKTKPNEEINIITSLNGNYFIQPDDAWQETFLTKIDNKIVLIQELVEQVENSTNEAKDIVDDLSQQTVDSLKNEVSVQIQNIIDEGFDSQITEIVETKVIETIKAATVNEVINYLGI